MTGRLMSALFLLAILALGGCQNPGRFQVPSSFLEPSDKPDMQVVFARHRTKQLSMASGVRPVRFGRPFRIRSA